MGAILRWGTPDTSTGFTHTRVYRCATETGTYTELSSSDIAEYVAGKGVPISYDQAHDRTGGATYYYKIRYYDDVNLNYSDYSEIMRAYDFRGYCMVEDIRSFTNLQDTEYSDNAVQLMIDTVTRRIDYLTGKTWQGLQESGTIYLDSDKGKTLYLPHTDIHSLVLLEIDKDLDGTWTAVTLDYVDIYSAEGMIALDSDRHNDIEVKSFSEGRKCVKISYKYGNDDPTQEIRLLAILMVLQMIKLDGTREAVIASILEALKRRSISTI